MYKLVVTKKFEKSFIKLDKSVQKLLVKWIKSNLVECENPRIHGKVLSANMRGIWRYRVADYRILAEINDKELIIIALNVSHRRDVYK